MQTFSLDPATAASINHMLVSLLQLLLVVLTNGASGSQGA
jgi:hypothetical protein